jgi:hypothetical protein
MGTLSRTAAARAKTAAVPARSPAMTILAVGRPVTSSGLMSARLASPDRAARLGRAQRRE